MNARPVLVAVLALGAAAVGAQMQPGFDGLPKGTPHLLPPYRIEVSPPTPADDHLEIRLRPAPSPALGLAVAVHNCTMSVWPESGVGTRWQGAKDPLCSRQQALRLPAGRYQVQLAMQWRARGENSDRSDTHSMPYEVRVGDRLRLRNWRVEPSQPRTRVLAKLIWEVENVGPVSVGPIAAQIVRDGQVVDRQRRATLAPGQAYSEGFSFTPAQTGPISLAIELDPENTLVEGPAHRGNNRSVLTVQVGEGPPPQPVLVLGALDTGPNQVRGVTAPRSYWSRAVTVCNLDPGARFVAKVEGPRCVDPFCRGLYSGTPANGEFSPGSWRDDGRTHNPPCPPGLELPGGLNTGGLQGPIGIVNTHHFELVVWAEKNGQRSPSATERWSVEPNCRPPCVAVER